MRGWIDDANVAFVRDEPRYPRTPPFHPSERYPEWPGAPISTEENPAFRAVRRAFIALGLDADAVGTPEWNPLAELIPRGGTVIVKPNLVTHYNHGASRGVRDTDSLVTHGSIVRAVVDYAARALRGSGRLVIADCPLQGTDWAALDAFTGLAAIHADASARFPGVEIVVRDLRLTKATLWRGQVVARVTDESARARYEEVDLGSQSLLVPLMQRPYAFGVTHYSRDRLRGAHTPGRNCYLLPRELLTADAFINVPKMKTHQKAGITCALKNLVGINGHKDYLPHFRFGGPSRGGDEYPDAGWPWELVSALAHLDWELERGISKRALLLARTVVNKLLLESGLVRREQAEVSGGAWHGNDTLWRTVLDINRAFLYYDPTQGKVGGTPARPGYLAVLDGIVAGEGNGPLEPRPVPAGVVLAGRNPAALDACAAALMGFDPARIAQLRNAFALRELPLTRFELDDVRLVGEAGTSRISEVSGRELVPSFEASPGYRGHIEWDAPPPSGAPPRTGT